MTLADVPAEWRDDVRERAAILEYSGMSRLAAQERALREWAATWN